jgi:hypothetical protein
LKLELISHFKNLNLNVIENYVNLINEELKLVEQRLAKIKAAEGNLQHIRLLEN